MVKITRKLKALRRLCRHEMHVENIFNVARRIIRNQKKIRQEKRLLWWSRKKPNTVQKKETSYADHDQKTILTERSRFNREIRKLESMQKNMKGSGHVLRTINNIPLRLSDLLTLKCKQWINDEVINAYFSILQKKHPENYFFSTFFFPKLTENDEYDYERVKRWTARKSIDLFSYNLVFFPINYQSCHWVLIVVDVKSQSIYMVDSAVEEADDRLTDIIATYLNDEARRLNLGTKPWDRFIAACAKQDNGDDCGMFLCLFAKNLSERKPLELTPKEVLNGRLYLFLTLMETEEKENGGQ